MEERNWWCVWQCFQKKRTLFKIVHMPQSELYMNCTWSVQKKPGTVHVWFKYSSSIVQVQSMYSLCTVQINYWYSSICLLCCTIKPQFDNINKQVADNDGTFVHKYWMFVDDLLNVIPRHVNNTRHFISSSKEWVYILIVYTDSIKNPTLPPPYCERRWPIVRLVLFGTA